METPFLNHDRYMAFAEKTKEDKVRYIETIVKNIENVNDDKLTDTFDALCSYTIDTNLRNIEEKKRIRGRILEDYVLFLLEDVTPENYERVIKRSFDTYDTYGLGLALSRLTFSMKRFITGDVYDRLKTFSYDLVHPNVFQRLTVEDAIRKYGAILERV